MTVDVDTTLAYQIRRLESLDAVESSLRAQGEALKVEFEQHGKHLALIDLSRQFYRKAVDLVYERSIGELEQVLCAALAFVFHDKQYHLKLHLDEKYSKSMEIIVLDKAFDPPLELAVEDGIGMGVRTVISFVLHSYYLLNRKCAPVIIVDEAYSYLSAEYVTRFFTFVKGLAQEKGLALIMVSHDERFLPFADRIYEVSDGHIRDLTQKNVTP